MKKIVVTILMLILMVVVCIAVFADSNPSYYAPVEITERNKEWIKEKDNAGNNTIISDFMDHDLDEKKAAFEEEESKDNENDLIAYSVLRKYGKAEIDKLITDKNEDYLVMELMCNMIKSQVLSEEETLILRKYLERRYYWIDDNDALKQLIVSVM